MIKRILNITLLALLLVACEQDNLDKQQPQTEVEVTFNFEFEDVAITRAISDGTTTDMLMYAIFRADNDEIVISKQTKSGASGAASSSGITTRMTLSAGVKYKAVFWLQSSKCNAYTVSDDMTVIVDYDGANNDETRDAFFGVSREFTVSDNSVGVILRRPFAQLNAGTFPFDWEYVKSFHKFDAVNSSLRIREVPNVINLKDGSVSGKVNASFTPGAMPTEMLLADVDENGVEEEYTYLSMSYILADSAPSTHTADFFFIDSEGRAVTYASESSTVTLQRNMRSDYVGQVLSQYGELNPRIYDDEGNTEDNNVYYRVTEDTTFEDRIYNMSDYASLQFGSEDGQTITYDNLLFTGDIWTIELGEYRNSWYVNYVNVLNNVEMRNLCCSSVIECHEWYFSPAVIAYGVTELNNCTMTGATTIREPVTDKHGITHEVIPVDIGVRNESDAVFNGGRYGTIFAWTHAVVDLNGVEVDTLYCGTCDSTKHSWMTIGAGTKIDKVICCEPRCPYGTKEYSTTMTIKSGAEVGSLQLVSTDVEFLIIEAGAKVGPITCEGVEYTYEELRAAMGL
jgi:hypothetical protein